MNTKTMFDIYGKEYKSFWSNVHNFYPNMPIVYYEVLVDFMDYFYDNQRPLQENMRMAYEYVVRHQKDYD